MLPGETNIDSLTSTVEWMRSIIIMVLSVILVVVLVRNVIDVMRGYGSVSRALLTLVFGVFIISGAYFVPSSLFGGASTNSTAEESTLPPGSSPSPSPSTQAPAPAPTSTSETSSSVDTGAPLLVLLWIGVGIAALVLIAAAIWGINMLRSAHKTKLKQEKARVEEHSKRVARWKTIVDRHEAMRLNVLRAETDWDMLFDLPALTDVSVQATSKLYRAMRDAENAVIDMPEDFELYTNLDYLAYPKAVRAFEEDWDAAYANAQKISTTKIPAKELKTIQRIRALLTLAEGVGATDHERHTAYTQIRKMLGELKHVSVPDRALLHIEEKQRLALAV